MNESMTGSRRQGLRLVLWATAIVMAFPFIWMISASFQTNAEILHYPPYLFPPSFHLQNYADVFHSAPFGRYIANTVIVATVTTALSLVVSTMAGYALAVLEFRGKRLVFLAIIATMMVPFYSLIVPMFVIVKDLGWVDTYQGLIVPWIPSAFGIFLMRQFYLTFPLQLKEAAILDGCSALGTFWRIAVPLSAPMLSALGIVTFMGNWQRFIWPLVVTTSGKMSTIPVAISQYQGQFGTQWNVLMAAAVVGTIPTLLIFIVFQRKIVEGIKLTGVKG